MPSTNLMSVAEHLARDSAGLLKLARISTGHASFLFQELSACLDRYVSKITTLALEDGRND